ncbi:MAG: glycosyltransferase [Dehalococcoidales bacterium]|nr:glycosyltransferase [Dehalococcoidales bacterium]
MRQGVSVIATVKNEEGSIGQLIDSLLAQSRPPDEIVIADGGSTDGTVLTIERFRRRGAPIRLLSLPGSNISQGRNAAIAAAQYEIIASTDAGVRLSKDWLAELVSPFERGDGGGEPPDVVSGVFLPDPKTTFEVAMGATVLPSLRDIKEDSFLPSSRSVAFTREAWRRAGGYHEWLDYCEDLIFDFALREVGCRFVLAPRAVAYFRPREDLGTFFKQYYRYARGDGKADLWRARHAVRYGTYLLGPLAFGLGFWYKLVWLPLGLAVGAYLYKPYQRLLPALGRTSRLGRVEAILLVPVIRLVGDVAKMLGYPVGIRWRLRHRAGKDWRA